MRCSNCGAENPDYAAFCGKCSADLSSSAPETSSREPTKAAEGTLAKPPELKKCLNCGRTVNALTPICPYCGKNPAGVWAPSAVSAYETSSYDSDYEDIAPRRTSGTAVAGGILALLAGILAAAQGALIASAGASLSYLPGSGSVCFCGGLDFLFGIIAIVGGVASLRQTGWGLAMAGAVFGMIGLGFIIGAVFGLIALILVAVSHADFD